jgi:Ca2+-binding RTX toxin-like protein
VKAGCCAHLSAGSLIATLNSSVPDTDNSFTYTLVTGSGATDNDSFSISGNNLIIESSPNYEAKSSYSLLLRSTDQGGLFTEKQFTFAVNNLIQEISSAASVILPSEYDNPIPTGSLNINGTGSSSDNLLTGNAGPKTLYGLAGNDRLYGCDGDETLDGGLGNDTMNGGADIFRFSNLPSYGAGGADRILDFSGSSSDRLLISKAAFGIANASASLINTNSTDLANALKTNNLFVYNTSNGHLYHNANGSAGSFGNGGIFAVLTNAAALQADWISLYPGLA